VNDREENEDKFQSSQKKVFEQILSYPQLIKRRKLLKLYTLHEIR